MYCDLVIVIDYVLCIIDTKKPHKTKYRVQSTYIHIHVFADACNSAAGYSHIVLASGDFCAKLNRSLVTYRHAAEQCKKENSHGHVIVIDSLVKEHSIERYMHNIHGKLKYKLKKKCLCM